MTEAQYLTQQYEEDEDVSDNDFVQLEQWGFLAERRALLDRIADLEAQLERQTNRALKWRRQAAYYKLREQRCMGEANYTSVERVDSLEGQRDDLAKALRLMLDIRADIASVGYPIESLRPGLDDMAEEAADALAQLKGDEHE